MRSLLFITAGTLLLLGIAAGNPGLGVPVDLVGLRIAAPLRNPVEKASQDPAGSTVRSRHTGENVVEILGLATGRRKVVTQDTLFDAGSDSTKPSVATLGVRSGEVDSAPVPNTLMDHVTTHRAKYTSADSVYVRLVSDSLLSALPDEILTAAFVFRNAARGVRVATPRIELPEGWLLIMAPSEVVLEPGSASVQLATLRIPAVARAGEATFRLALEDSSGVLLASAEILITVETVRALTISFGPQPEFVAAGDRYTIPVVVSNSGNTDANVRMGVRIGGSESVSMDRNEVRLEPGQNSEIVATVETNSELPKPTPSTVRVSATIAGHPESRVAATSVVEVIPVHERLQPAPDPMEVLLTMGAVGDDRNRGLFFAADGAGAFLGGQVDFDVRFPDRRNVTRFGRRDAYVASYRSESVDLVVGDQSFGLSPLTTEGDYAFGAATSFRTEWLEVKALSQRSRYSLFDYSLHGAGIEIRPDAESGIGLNVLTREGLYDGTITTVRGKFSPFRGSSLDLECGLDDVDGFENPACAMSLTGAEGGVRYRGRLFRAGENYPGYSNGLTQGAVGLQWRPSSNWTLRADVDHSKKNGSSDLSRDRFTSLTGVGYRGRFGTSTIGSELQLFASSTNYRSVRSTLDRKEETLRLSTFVQRSVVSLNFSLDLGRARSESQGYDGSVRRGAIRAQVRPTRSFDVNAFLEHVTGFASTLPQTVSRWFSGLQAMWQPDRRTRLRTGFTRSLDSGILERAYTSLDARIDLELPWRHRVSAHLRRSVDDARTTSTYNDYRFGYTVPINIPMPNTTRSPRKMSGRVYDSATGRGIPGVLLHLGDSMTLTDERGRFRFAIDQLESRRLQVNQRSIGLDHVPLVPTPISVSPGEADVEVDVPISLGAVLSGSLIRFDPDRNTLIAGDSVRIEKAIPGAIVEIRSKERAYRARSNDQGSFTFTNIPPGDYDVTILQARVAARYRWEADAMKVSLAPGETRRIVFRLLPVLRTLRRIDGGVVRPTPGSSN